MLLLAACPKLDQEGKYDDFGERTQEAREMAMNVKMDLGGTVADVSGNFLFALSSTLEKTLPLQFYTTATFTAEGEGGTLDLELQPLSLSIGSTTEPRQFVGEPLVIPGVMVDASGGFTFELVDPPVQVTGEANPLTGSNIKATLTITGSIQSEDVFCGNVSGTLIEPTTVDLTGSTFAAVRVSGPDALPTEIVALCPEGGAEGGTSGENPDATTGTGA